MERTDKFAEEENRKLRIYYSGSPSSGEESQETFVPVLSEREVLGFMPCQLVFSAAILAVMWSSILQALMQKAF